MRMRVLAIVAMVVGGASLSGPRVSAAGPLNLHPDAIGGCEWLLVDRCSTAVPYNDGLGHSGMLEFAVFLAADFEANFGGLGYVPGDAFVYTYQLFSTGSDPIDAFAVELKGDAKTLGAFNIGGRGPSDTQIASLDDWLVAAAAHWIFKPGILAPEITFGLALSSSRPPTRGLAFAVFSEIFPFTSFHVAAVPVPSAVPVPEPASIALVAAGLAIVRSLRRHRAGTSTTMNRAHGRDLQGLHLVQPCGRQPSGAGAPIRTAPVCEAVLPAARDARVPRQDQPAAHARPLA